MISAGLRLSLLPSVRSKTGWGIGLLAAVLLAGAAAPTARAQSYRVRSPDGPLVATVRTGGEQLTYAVSYDGQPLVQPSPIGMTLGDGTVLGEAPTVDDTSRRRVHRTLRPVVPTKRAAVPDRFRELRIDFATDGALVVRAYDGGVAYRFVTQRGDSLTVAGETATFDLAAEVGGASPTYYWARNEDSFITHAESYYQPPLPPDSIGGRMTTAPLTVRYGTEGPLVTLTEAGLRDYAGMFLVGDSTAAPTAHRLHGTFPRRALATAVQGDDPRNTYPTRRADDLARTAGARAFPWRVVIVAPDAAALYENQLTYTLAPKRRLNDTDWIDPGKVAWDWWHARNLFGVDFEAGVNTRTYKHYIDFAAAQGLDYVILDEGWSDPADLTDVADAIDMEALTAYAAKKDVGLILWCVWKTLDRQMQTALDQFEEWGIAGIKVDFMQRDDQDVVNFYWRTAREAAERELLVNFHGSYKPTGLRRAYPNVLTREGVNGMEQSKWTDRVTPRHDVTIPFTRMVAGPMDYTPGAMVNAHTDNFAARWARPMSQGTRAHQLAMYVVYESPMQMLADSPSHYRRAPQSMDFLAAVPTTWHETHAFRARIGDYVAVARRHGDEWYLGAMSDGTARTLDLPLSFLETGRTYRLTGWRDGPNADRYAEDLQQYGHTVTARDTVTVEMAAGGGFAGRLRPVDGPLGK